MSDNHVVSEPSVEHAIALQAKIAQAKYAREQNSLLDSVEVLKSLEYTKLDSLLEFVKLSKHEKRRLYRHGKLPKRLMLYASPKIRECDLSSRLKRRVDRLHSIFARGQVYYSRLDPTILGTYHVKRQHKSTDSVLARILA